VVDETTRLSALVGGPTARKLDASRGLRTVGDLLSFWPRRYYTRTSDLSRLHEGAYVVVVAEVKRATTSRMRQRRGRKLDVVITDGTRDLDLVYFSAYGHEGKLVPGARAIFAGKVTRYHQRWQLAHPEYELFDDQPPVTQRDLIPIYLPVKGLQPWAVSRAVGIVLDHLDEAVDPLPSDVRRARSLVPRLEALRGIHTPDTMAQVERSRRRMRFEEAFILQAALAQRRASQSHDATVSRQARPGGVLEAFDRRLPFELTSGQRQVGTVIAHEMAREVPMNRLLQGEVGSGKTVVALRAMLAAVDAGGQAALLAPTEVLAAQHHRTIRGLLGDLADGGLLGGPEVGTRVVLLSGSQPTPDRRQALRDIASGEAGIVVGTHALIQEAVSFRDLALAVVDEQHRFGVEQRDALRSKGAHPPHVLVMTATPIPRTVAMTVFGDMETSTLRELPAGRAPITTHVVPEGRPGWMPRTWERVAEEVRAGHQAYVVCPRIGGEDDLAGAGGDLDGLDEWQDAVVDDDIDAEDTDGVESPGPPRDLKGVYAVHAQLVADPALAGLRIELLHGRLPPEERDAVMTRFGRGELDVLVSTTVVEVGVDVANATVMVVMDADRFGISQLHQLRGRVGRGGLPGLCLLVTGSETETATQRLAAVASTTDGFELARLDLSLRREGDVLGARQSGARTQLDFLSVLRHEDVIVQAREDAFALVGADPELSAHPQLAQAVARRLDADQAAYLERG
jgi:ATP-dependent DNA helicase RecG